MSASSSVRRFCLVLVKPTHYCDDGYPIRWFRSTIPSNSLACVYGIAEDCAKRNVLGEGVEIEIHALDESNTRIRPQRIAELVQAADAGMVMLIGVQSNQMPRALDIARPLREMGIQVAVGGFHVSGVIAMIDGDDPSLREAQAMGLSVFAGEAEGRLDEVLRDALSRQLKPLYNYMKDLPGIDGAPFPLLKRNASNASPEQRQASMPGEAAHINVVLHHHQCAGAQVTAAHARRCGKNRSKQCGSGNLPILITDDNFARNKDWEIILDRLIYLREVEKINLSLMIQVDTMCHKLPNFIAKCGRAGVKKAYIGLENINPANLMAAKKKQNKITEYRTMLLEWQKTGILIYAGYITGFPHDTAKLILNDLEVIKKELPIDVLEIHCLTPLPGSEDHQKLFRAGAWMDPDLNKYDLHHITCEHPRMSKEEWAYAYQESWKRYYSYEHCETVMRRSAVLRHRFGNVLMWMSWFKASFELENCHPVESGLFRLKSRRDRRPTLPIESIWGFYPKYFAELVRKAVGWLEIYFRLRRVYLSIKHDLKRHEYTDLAITPVIDDEVETHELFHNDAARAFVESERRIEKIIRRGAAASDPTETRDRVAV